MQACPDCDFRPKYIVPVSSRSMIFGGNRSDSSVYRKIRDTMA